MQRSIALLDAIPALIRRHIVFESLDVERLTEDQPRFTSLDLAKRSIRGQRYYLTRAQIPLKAYTTPLPFPRFTSITPADVEALELEGRLNKCEIQKSVENSPLGDHAPKARRLHYLEPPLMEISPVIGSGRYPARSRSP